MVHKARKSNYRWHLVVPVVATLLIAGAGITWFVHQHKPKPTAQNNSDHQVKPFDKQPTYVDNQNVTPPTDNPSSSSQSDTSQAAATISVFIVDASQYGDMVEVRAHANTISDGTCSYTFTNAQTSFARQTAATADASTSSCETLDVKRSDFARSGDWTVSVKYVSTTGAYGVSSKTFAVK